MILFDFRYQDPWSEGTIVFPNFIEQSQARQRQDQQADINRKTLDTLLTKLSQKDIVGLDHAKEYLRHKYRCPRFLIFRSDGKMIAVLYSLKCTI